MNNTVRNKKTVLALSLATLVSGLSSNVYAKAPECCSAPAVTAATTFLGMFAWDLIKKNEAFTPGKLGRNAAAAAALALFARYYTKESVVEAEYKETGDVKKLADVKNVLSKEYWENFLTVIDEQIVGQRPKDGKIKVEQKGDKLTLGGEISPRKPAKGFMGKAEDIAKPMQDAAQSAVKVLAVLFGLKTAKEYIEKGLGFDKLQKLANTRREQAAPEAAPVQRIQLVDAAGNPIRVTVTPETTE